MGDLPAILGGTPVRENQSWPEWPQFGDAERELLASTLESGRWSGARGHLAAEFASEFAAFQGARHGLALANGSCSLEVALAACGVGAGDEVLVPGLTFVTTAISVLAVNAVLAVAIGCSIYLLARLVRAGDVNQALRPAGIFRGDET